MTSERDSYRRTLKESRDEKDRLIVKYEERLHEQEQQVISMWVADEFLIFSRFKAFSAFFRGDYIKQHKCLQATRNFER